jgi:hypothetical protein
MTDFRIYENDIDLLNVALAPKTSFSKARKQAQPFAGDSRPAYAFRDSEIRSLRITPTQPFSHQSKVHDRDMHPRAPRQNCRRMSCNISLRLPGDRPADCFMRSDNQNFDGAITLSRAPNLNSVNRTNRGLKGSPVMSATTISDLGSTNKICFSTIATS